MVLCGDEVDEVRLVYGGSSLLIPHFYGYWLNLFPIQNFLGQINNAQLNSANWGGKGEAIDDYYLKIVKELGPGAISYNPVWFQ